MAAADGECASRAVMPWKLVPVGVMSEDGWCARQDLNLHGVTH